MLLVPQAWKLSKMLVFLSTSWCFGPAGLGFFQNVNVFVKKLMLFDPLVEKLDVFGSAGLEIVQNLILLSKSWCFFGSAGLEINKHVNVFVQKLMFFVSLVEKLDVLSPAGLEIVQNVVFVQKLMFWSRRLGNHDVFGPAGLGIVQNVNVFVHKSIFLATSSCKMTS